MFDLHNRGPKARRGFVDQLLTVLPRGIADFYHVLFNRNMICAMICV